MIPRITRLGAALAVVAAVALTPACAATTPPAAEPTASTAPTPETPAPEGTEAPSEPVDHGDPACDTIIGEAILAEYEEIGWTVQVEPFRLGEVELAEGLQCVWADYEGPAGDHLQIFGWAVVDDETAAEAQDALVAEGWIREDEPAGVYITENPETTIAPDAEGYGMTYLFADGWVKLADTKQSLLLIEWPPAA
jgi:hypothetical protein